MKFKCEKCGTRYTIADQKIRSKVLKIRCKICEHVIIVRDPTAEPTPEPRAAAREQVAGIFDVPVGASEQSEDRTVVSDPLGQVIDVEWYAAPGGDTVGPMPFERLRDMIHHREVGADDVVWNETMGDWAAVKDVPALAELLKLKHSPPPPLPPRLRHEEPPPPTPAPAPGGEGLLDRLEHELSPAPPAAGPGLFGLDLSRPPESAPAPPPAVPDEDRSEEVPLEPLFGAGLFDAEPAPAEALADTEALPATSSGTVPVVPPAGPAPSPPAPQAIAQPAPALAAPPFFPAGESVEIPAAHHTGSAPYPAASAGHSVVAPLPSPAQRLLPVFAGALLLVLGVGMGIYLAPGGKEQPAPTPPAPAPQPVAAAPAPAQTPAPAPTSPKPAAEPQPAAAPDAGIAEVEADAAPVVAEAQPKPKARPKRRAEPARRRAPEPEPEAEPKPARPSRFGALDEGKSQVAVAAPTPREEVLPETISQGEIMAVMKRQQRGLRTCYERQLKRDDSLSGKIMLRFSIEKSGRTSNVRLPQRFDGTVLQTCLSALVGRWRFPRFTGESIKVEYPLVLTASL